MAFQSGRRGVTTGYLVRPGRQEDVQGLPDLELAAAASYADLGMPDVAIIEPTSVDVHSAAVRDGLLTVVCPQGRSPVGFALWALVDDDLYLYELDVHPRHRGQRLGARLIDAGNEIAARNRKQAISLTTFVHVPWNAPYYRRLGFCDVAGTLGPQMIEEWERQRLHGLDMDKRVVMRRLLPEAPTRRQP